MSRTAKTVGIPLQIKYNVYLAHASEDEDLAKTVKETLEAEKYQVMIYKEDFDARFTVLRNIATKIDESLRMVFLLTENSLEKSFPRYEANEGIRRMLNEKIQYVIVLRNGVPRERVPPSLRWVQDIDYNDRKVPWIDKVKYCIRESQPLEIGLNGNDVGFGMAWSYFYSYLNIIVPPQGPEGGRLDMKGRIEKYLATREKQQITYMPRKIYILVPESGILPSSIADVNDRVNVRDKKSDKLKTTVMRGGTERPYLNTIYTIEDGSKVYQCIVEYATVLQPLKEMEDNVRLTTFLAIDREVQIKIFYQMLKNIIRNTFTDEQQAMVELIHITGDGDLCDILLQKIKKDEDDCVKEDVARETEMEVDTSNDGKVDVPVGYQAAPCLRNDMSYHAFLTYAGEVDEGMASDIRNMLSNSGFQIASKDDFTGGAIVLQELPKLMNRSQRMILLVTEDFLKKGGSLYEAKQAITKMIEMNERYVVVLRNGVERKEMPKFLHWATDIDYEEEPNVRNRKLIFALTDNTPLEVDLLGNDVGFGMAWAYFYSYLNIIVPPQGPEGEKALDLKGRIDKHVASHGNKGIKYMPRKIFILVPESGILPGNIADADNRITLLDKNNDKLETLVARGGTPRPYKNMIRTIQDGADKYQCLVEYATAIQPLKEMEDNPELPSFKADDRFEQVKIFKETLQNVIHETFNPEQRAMVEVIEIRDLDGASLPLADLLLQRIKADMPD
ncbi:unnamed protein product [Owenia fusiformis]|uniref:Uncharacterized protein n=1 Tax=Owenia fusiformis TaxID=6347 RepID=A0A8J1XEP6_OWEFU|nr:unnamed protein product [Owenia fusiformis]